MSGNDTNTKVLLHCDGTNGSTSFPDLNIGGGAHTWSATGATVATAQSEFGGASASFSGNAQYIQASSSADWNFSGDFTVDYWIRFTSLGTNANTMTSAHWTNNDGSGSICASLHGTATPNFAWGLDFNTSFTGSILASSAPVINTWYHVAIVRSGTTVTLYINGTSVGSVTNGSTFANGTFSIGRATQYGTGSNRDLAGFIDEFRVSNVARWTTNFTPPVAAYSAVYSLSTAAGSYSLTGIAALVGRLFKLSTVAGAYSVAGAAVSFIHGIGYRLSTVAGSYSLVGVSLSQVVRAASQPIRAAKFILQKLRVSTPTLSQ